MGQQQLLLLVLGIVIVGIAVVAGIQAFSEGKGKAAQDAAVSDAMRIISDLQAWKLKPQAFGGGDGVSGFTGVTFKHIGIDPAKDLNTSTATTYETMNGCYTITAGANATVTLYKRENNACLATAFSTVTVAGTGTSDITWSYN